MNVYCKDCKFVQHIFRTDQCKASRRVISKPSYYQPNNKTVMEGICSDLNENNNCSNYKPSLWKRITNKLFRTKNRIK